MIIRFLLTTATLLFLNSSYLYSQIDTLGVNNSRVLLVGSSLALSLGASYAYVENAWWKDISSEFHFDPGNDLVYALNVDKAAHFLGGVYASDLFSQSFLWTGMKRKKALWYGALFGSSIQLAIEMKDAYAPYWGFSKYDLGLGSLGSFWPVMQSYSKGLSALNFKFSYFKHSNIYWDLEAQRDKNPSRFAWYDDYPNQTYWISADLNYFLKTKQIPDWLNIAVGFGLDDTQYLDNSKKIGGNNEYYIALDYNILKLLKNWQTPLSRKIKYFLKYLKLPAPTIRVSPKFKFYPFFI
tara:strand:+ start:61483 stop:62370 length:888 start_codon:yes stop_codon:yes gene_type:complete